MMMMMMTMTTMMMMMMMIGAPGTVSKSLRQYLTKKARN
jgi:hypothetical protein